MSNPTALHRYPFLVLSSCLACASDAPTQTDATSIADGGPSGVATVDATGSAGPGSGPPSDTDTAVGDASTASDGAAGESGSVGPGDAAFPVGLAVASPTASAATMMTGASIDVAASTLTRAPTSLSSTRGAMAGATLAPGKPYAVKQAELAAMIAGVDCDLVLGPLGGGFNPMCYGPWLDYENHPDAPMGMSTDGQLPSGDLGLWMATDPGGQACASVKLNALVDDVALKVDYGLYLAANLQCTMVVDGVGAPDVGASLDRTTAVNASLSATNPGVTVSRAELTREPDDGTRSVFRYELELSVDQGGPAPIAMTTTLVHRADAVDPADYRGRVWSRFDHVTPSDDGYAYALEYAQDTAGLRYDVQAANYPPMATDPFSADGALDFSVPYQGGATRAAVALDPATGSADLLFAWQAGPQDGNSRVFNVAVDFDADSGSGSGCGFFGFGAPFTAGGPPDGSISTFICNWAGPGNQHVGEVGWAQKQCMETDDQGRFVPTQSHIAYAPVNDCDSTTDPAFAYRDPTQLDFSSDPIARDLVELAVDSDYASWTQPDAP